MLCNKLSCLHAIIFACLGICFAINTFASQFVNTNMTSVFLIIFFCLYVLYQQPISILRFPFAYFIAATNLIGVIIIEYGNIHLDELNVFSSANNSLAVLVLGWFLFLSTMFWLESFYPYDYNLELPCQTKVKIKNIAIEFNTLFLMSFLIFLIPFLIKVLPHPYFLEKVDRFLYFAYFFSDSEKRILNIFNYFLPVIVALMIKYRSKFSLFILCAYILMKFFMGEKFGLFFYIFCYFVIFAGSNITLTKTIIVKYAFRAFIVFAILISVVFGHRALLYNADLGGNFTYLIQRTAQNGQLWWALYPEARENHFNFTELSDEVGSFYAFDYNINYSTGIYKVMKKTTPAKIFNAKIDAKSRYADSTFATIFYYFGIPGIFLFSIFVAALYWVLVRYMIYAFNNIFIFDLLVMGKLFSVANTVLTQSDFNLLFSYQTLLCLIGLLGLNLFRSFAINHCRQGAV